MALIRKWWERQRWSGVAGLLCALAVGLLSLTPFLERLELRTQDVRFHLRGPRKTGAKIVIAEISDATFVAWKDPLAFWGAHYATAIEKARALGAQWIGLDIIPAVTADEYLQSVFGASPDALPDLKLARALAGGNVVLANIHSASEEPINPIDMLIFAHPQQPENVGFVDTRPELDDVVRTASIFNEDGNRLVPSFPAVLAARVRGQSPMDAEALRALANSSAHESEAGTIWINYVGPTGSFPHLPLERLTTGALTDTERSWVREAVVLIGPTYRGSNDKHRGPADTYYNGVDIHAHTLATLLDQRPLRRATRFQEAIITMTLGTLMAAAVALLPFGWGLVLLITVSGAWGWAAVRAFASDALWPTAGPLLALALAWIGHHSVRSLEEARRRRWVQGLFGRYISPEIVTHLLLNPAHLKLGGEEREVSILFLDIRGFTTYSQGRPPSAVMNELNDFFCEIVPVIDRCEGLLYKYTGDGLLAVFGAPRGVKNHAQAAVAAAIEIVKVSRRISAARALKGGEPLRVGCSVNSGLVVCGNLGASERSEYTVIGDTVNLAARLEELNKSKELNTEFTSEVVISEATYVRLNDPPPTRGPFEFEIRGRAGRVRVYQVRIAE